MSEREVGPSSVKSLYRTFVKHNKDVQFPNLKTFARNLVRNGTDEEKTAAVAWFANKGGKLQRQAQAERLKNKGARIALEKQATKQARRKLGAGKSKTAAPAAA